jgi:hypothetical protein
VERQISAFGPCWSFHPKPAFGNGGSVQETALCFARPPSPGLQRSVSKGSSEIGSGNRVHAAGSLVSAHVSFQTDFFLFGCLHTAVDHFSIRGESLILTRGPEDRAFSTSSESRSHRLRSSRHRILD